MVPADRSPPRTQNKPLNKPKFNRTISFFATFAFYHASKQSNGRLVQGALSSFCLARESLRHSRSYPFRKQKEGVIMTADTKARLDARADNLSALDRAELNKTTHGIAARIDRMPVGRWQKKLMWLFGGAIFIDSLDNYVGGGILAQLVSEGWSTIDQNSLFVSMTMFGYLIGSFLSGYLGDRFGRRKALLINVMIFTVATFFAAFAPSMNVLIAARFLMGIGLGATMPGCYAAFPEYLTPKIRGKYSGYIGLIGNVSPPIGALLTMLIIPVVGWRPIFILISIVALGIWFLIFKFLDESPRWYTSKGRYEEADAKLTEVENAYRSRGIEVPELTDEQLEEVRKANEEMNEVVDLPWRALFGKKMIRRTITVSVGLMAMNLVVQTITNWTPTLFVMQGVDVGKSLYMTVIMLIGCPVGVLIESLLVDKHPRKWGMVILLIAIAIAGFAWSQQTDPTIVMVVGFILCALTYYYALVACSAYLGEVFPTELRLRGGGFANAMGRVAAIVSPSIIAGCFAAANPAGAVYTFIGITLFVMALIIAICGVETRGQTLEKINDEVVQEYRDKQKK